MIKNNRFAAFFSSEKRNVLLLFLLACITQSLFLTRVPGFMGDEGSEGENVYNLLHAHTITLFGERSYISAWVDYARVPFMLLFGYTPLAIRLPVLCLSLLLFWITWRLLHRFLPSLLAETTLVFLFFSPIYLTHQRIGWAITLLPFFTILTIFLLLKTFQQRPLSAGLPLLFGFSAGLGLATHLLFLPTLWSIFVLGICLFLRTPVLLMRLWPSLLGFWAGFGTQFAILLTQHDDQGDPLQVAESIGQRLHDLPLVLPLVLSGSSFVASITGHAFSALAVGSILFLLGVGTFSSFLFQKTRLPAFLLLGMLLAHLLVLVFLIDRFSLRYFVVFTLGVWTLAGMGIGGWIAWGEKRFRFLSFAPLFLALLFVCWNILSVYRPFFATEGSTEFFSLGNRTDSAEASVDIAPLLSCIAGKGTVYSDSVHIYNRLQYLSHSRHDIAATEHPKDATLYVTYKDASHAPHPDTELCPALTHFVVRPLGKK